MPSIDLSQVVITHNRDAQRFEAAFDGHLALAEYDLSNDVYTFTHSEVPPEFQGQGIAGKLIHEALETVRLEHRRLVPACSYVRAYIDKHPEYEPLVAQN